MSDVAEGVTLDTTIVKCRNCGAPVFGRFCAECGQSLRDLDRSIWTLVRESLQEIVSVEGRLYRTMRVLVTHPGALTSEYVVGRRAHYTSPIRLYLVASAAFFLGFRLARVMDPANHGYVGPGGAAYYDALATLFILLPPTLALVLKLAYWRARRPLLHHLVFSLHTGTTALLWILAITLVASAVRGVGGPQVAASSWFPEFLFWFYLTGQIAVLGYVVMALRRTYGSGWVGSLLRAIIMASAAATAFRLLLPIIVRLQGEL